MSDREPVSIEKMRARLQYRKGWRSLLRYLQAVQKAHGVTFVMEMPGRTLTRYRVTLSSIRRHAPELMPEEERPSLPVSRGDASAARDLIINLEERVGDIAADVIERRVMPRIEALERGTVRN